MQYRTLGKTTLKVAEVGMGTWQLANDPNCWIGSDLNQSYRSLERYVELGGNFIDTAWIYGYSGVAPSVHPSENLIRKFIRTTHSRDRLILATKVPPKNMHWPALPDVSVHQVFPSAWIKQCVDDSLQSLGVDTIDVMQFHVWQDDFVSQGDWADTIQEIIKSGKVRYWGISANDYQPANCLRALDTGLFSTVQFIFNIFHQLPTKQLFPYAKAHNIGLIARVPLDEGGLSGKFTLGTEFSSGDIRKTYFGGSRLSDLVIRTDRLKNLLGNESETLVELALRYILSWSEVSTVIPGLRRVAHVEQNIAVSDGRKLSLPLLGQLKSHAWERNFYN